MLRLTSLSLSEWEIVRGENRVRESVLLQDSQHQHNCLTSQDYRSLHTPHIVTVSHTWDWVNWPHIYHVMSCQPGMVMIWISPDDDSSSRMKVRSLTAGRLDSRRVCRVFLLAAVLTEIILSGSLVAWLSLLAKCIANNLTERLRCQLINTDTSFIFITL